MHGTVITTARSHNCLYSAGSECKLGRRKGLTLVFKGSLSSLSRYLCNKAP